MRGAAWVLAPVAASRDFLQVQSSGPVFFDAQPVALPGEAATHGAGRGGLAVSGLVFDFVAPQAPAALESLYSPSDDYVITACIVGIAAILGYSFQARRSVPAPVAAPVASHDAALRLAGRLRETSRDQSGGDADNRTAILAVEGRSLVEGRSIVEGRSLAKVGLDPATVAKAKLLAECAGGLPAAVQPDRATVAELLLRLEACNKTQSPTTSALLNGKWRFLYASGASPALQTLQIMLKGVHAISKTPFGPGPVAIEDTYLTITAQRYASASTKVRMNGLMPFETTLTLKSKLVVDSPVRLIETYESAGSTPAGLLPSAQLPALPYKRPVLVSYLDETMLVVRDAAGRPDVLTRVDAVEMDTTEDDVDEVTPHLPRVLKDAEEEIGEAVVGLEEKVKDFAIGVSDGAQEIVHDVSDTVQTAEQVLGKAAVETLERSLNWKFKTKNWNWKLGVPEQAAFFERQAEAMKERAVFFKQLQDDYDATAAQQKKPLGAREASAFCSEKAEHLQRDADAATERAASALHEVEETRRDLRFLDRPGSAVAPDLRAAARPPLEARAARFQAEADALTDRVSFLIQEAGEMRARAKVLGAAETAAGTTCLMALRAGVFHQEAEAMTERAEFFKERASFLNGVAADVAAAEATGRGTTPEATEAGAAEHAAEGDRVAFSDRASEVKKNEAAKNEHTITSENHITRTEYDELTDQYIEYALKGGKWVEIEGGKKFARTERQVEPTKKQRPFRSLRRSPPTAEELAAKAAAKADRKAQTDYAYSRRFFESDWDAWSAEASKIEATRSEEVAEAVKAEEKKVEKAIKKRGML